MTPQPHIIRLRDPWQWVAADSSAAADCAAASICVSRRFNRPTGLRASTRVVLVIEGISSLQSVHLNDQILVGARPADAIWKYEIGERLELRNQLRLEFDSDPAETEDHLRTLLAAGNVRLEIYE